MSQIITQIEPHFQTPWQKELANVITDPKMLLEMLEINPTDYLFHFNARKLFPVRVPKPFLDRMEKGNFNDPLLQQVMPLNKEFDITPGYVSDPLEEHNSVAEGLLHKYKHRVLMIVKSGCAVNCRYCFRRHFPYKDNSPNKQRWQQALNYIREHTEVTEVIFSGGDPLMASDQHLMWLVQQIEDIPHVSRLRVHTRLPVVIPQRITQELLNMLTSSRLKPTVVLHINHANEIDDNLITHIEKFRDARIPLFNQSTLLKGINDNAEILCNLSEKLFDNGIQPYYLHLFDQVQGAAHFDVTDDKATELAKSMLATLPGYLVPKVVREIAGEANKTPLNLR